MSSAIHLPLRSIMTRLPHQFMIECCFLVGRCRHICLENTSAQRCFNKNRVISYIETSCCQSMNIFSFCLIHNDLSINIPSIMWSVIARSSPSSISKDAKSNNKNVNNDFNEKLKTISKLIDFCAYNYVLTAENYAFIKIQISQSVVRCHKPLQSCILCPTFESNNNT